MPNLGWREEKRGNEVAALVEGIVRTSRDLKGAIVWLEEGLNRWRYLASIGSIL